MKISYRNLEILSIIYIYFNVIIFLGGWLRPSVAIPTLILLFYVFYKRYFVNWKHSEDFVFIEKKIFGLIFIGIATWMIASGIGGFCCQAGDWYKHNAILRDLVNYKWPVK